MKNYQSSGATLTLIAPAGGVTAGKLVKVGAVVVAPVDSAAAGAEFVGHLLGEYRSAATITADVAAGAKAYLLADGSGVTNVNTDNTEIGVFSAPAGNGAAEALVRLSGVPV